MKEAIMGKTVKEPTIKAEAIALIEHLPDDCTLADIQYSLYVRQKIDEGLADVEAGKLIPHEEAKRRMREWLKSRGHRQRSGNGKKSSSTSASTRRKPRKHSAND